MTEKKLMTVTEAAEMLMKEKYGNENLNDADFERLLVNLKVKIYYGIKNNHLNFLRTSHILLNENEVKNYFSKTRKKITHYSPFEGIDLDFDESLKPIESFQNPNAIEKPMKYVMKIQYAVSNKGRIFNLTNHRELTPYSENDKGYLQVTLCTNGKPFTEKWHKIVATMWCPNSKLKGETHHIDGDHRNNLAKNLIWVTKAEHNKAHRLLKEAKKKNDFKEYDSFIEKIKNDNQWEKEYRCLAFEKEKNIIFVWITKESYVDFKKGLKSLDEISTDEVKAERIVGK